MSYLRWPLKLSNRNTSKTCHPIVYFTRTFLIHVSIRLWSINPLGCVVMMTSHSLILIFIEICCVFTLKVTNSCNILPEAVQVKVTIKRHLCAPVLRIMIFFDSFPVQMVGFDAIAKQAGVSSMLMIKSFVNSCFDVCNKGYLFFQ